MTARSYNIHRWYEPTTARYSTPDPVPQGWDTREKVYAYAASNPLSFFDSSGLAAEGAPSCCDCPDQLWTYSGASAGFGLGFGWTNFHGTFTCRSRRELKVPVDGNCFSIGLQAFATVLSWDFSPGPLFPAAKACKVQDLFAASRGIVAGVFFFGAQGDLRGGTGTVSIQLSVGRGVAGYRCRAKPYIPINSM